MKSVKIILLAGLLGFGQMAHAERLRDSLLFFSTIFAPEITTYGPLTTLAGSGVSMRITEALENISYSISVDNRIDEREVLDLRDDAVDYLSDGHQSTTLKLFSDEVKKYEGAEHLTDEQIASYVIAVASFL